MADDDGVTTIAERRAQERIARQEGVETSEVQDVELDAQGQVTDARLSEDARRRRVAQRTEEYSQDDLTVADGEVRVREDVKRQRAAAQNEQLDPEDFRVADDGTVELREPTEAVDVTVWDPGEDDPSGEVVVVNRDTGERIETGVETGGGGEPFFAELDAPDSEGQFAVQVGGETVETFEIEGPGAAIDDPQRDYTQGFNANRISLDNGEAEQTQDAFEPKEDDGPDATVAGAGAAEALQAGADPEELSQVNPISEREGERIADRLEQQEDAPSGNPAMRGTDANEQIRDRLASQNDDLEPDDIDVVQTGSGLQARIERDARDVDPQEATERARERGVGDDPDALDRLDGDADRGVSVTRPGGQGGVATGAPEPEPATVDVEVGQQDRGVGVTRGPEGTTVVRPEQTGSDVARTGQQQLDAQQSPSPGEVRASVNRFGQQQLDAGETQADDSDQPPLAEAERDYSAVEVLTGQAAREDPQFEQAAINRALAAAGVEEELGFREPTRGQRDPVPGDESALRFARGAGPRRQFEVESETAGQAVTDVVSDRRAQAAAAAGVVAPEPSTTLGGAALLATGAVAAAASEQSRDTSVSPFTEEVEIPEDDSRSELETPEEQAVREVDVPDEQQTVAPSELGIPEEALEPDESGEVPVDVSGGARITDDGEVELPAETSGVVVYRNRDEEEEEDAEDEDAEDEDEADEEEEDAEEEEEVAVNVPDELLNDEEQTIGGEPAEPEVEERAEPEAIQEEADPEQEEETLDETLIRRPRQGQQSDAAEPEETTVDEVDPLTDDDAVIEESIDDSETSQQVDPATVIGGPAGVTVGAGLEARDRDETTLNQTRAPDTDVGAGLDEEVGSDVFDATATDTRLDSAARVDTAVDAQLDSAITSATASLSAQGLQTAPQTQPSQQTTQPQQQQMSPEEVVDETMTDFGRDGSRTPERIPRPDLGGDPETDDSLLAGFGVDDRVFDTGVVQSLNELDEETANPDPFADVDDALDGLNF